ncbi:MAG: BtrH N-terminal domain-containing protein [Anaerolineae bacterium]
MLAGFQHFPTHHCVTGSLRHIYVYNGLDLSEEMLLGLGAGVSFSYWHFTGQPPFIGGRGGMKPPLEEVTGRRTGVKVEMHTTSSVRKARQALLEMLDAGQPVMIGCDMGFLPYFDFGGEEYHFGGHAVVVCGYDADRDQVLVADRDEQVHPVPMADLAQARASTYKPFPPKNLWYTFDFGHKRPPAVDDVHQAILEMATVMLEPPIRNLGVKGIRKAAVEVARWPQKLSADELRFALFNTYIFIAPEGGTGGGCFRYMLSRFLDEAADLAGEPGLAESAAEFRQVGDGWEALGAWFRQASEAPEPAAVVAEATPLFQALADEEEAAWQRLREIVLAD